MMTLATFRHFALLSPSAGAEISAASSLLFSSLSSLRMRVGSEEVAQRRERERAREWTENKDKRNGPGTEKPLR